MKFKVLLAGKNSTVINDFFSVINENFEILTTSIRWDDIVGHIKYFEPDAFCFCVYNETKDIINRMIVLKEVLDEDKIPFILVGSEEECADFSQIAFSTADLKLTTPIKASVIEEQISKFLTQRRIEEEQRIAEEKRIKEEQEKEAERARRKHVLVVDDDSTMLKTIKEQLHDKYDVATAISGRIALKFLERKTTDIILLDYQMPEETGPEVLEQIRENEKTKDIPVIFLTGVTEREKITQALVMKPQGYLLKPIEYDKLIESIEKILEGKNGEGEG